MMILGIESTCDETALAIVEDGETVLEHLIASSQDLHKKTGGIVPEVSSRAQVESILALILYLKKKHDLSKIDRIAVAVGPGLIGSLLVGVQAAKFLSFYLNKPLLAVNHLHGHLFANFIDSDKPKFPALGLVISGGHTDMVLMNDFYNIILLGSTKDDAVGEAFDKAARILGLGYPGGPEIDKLFFEYRDKFKRDFLPRPMLNDGGFDFSFSGLKTSVLYNKNKFSTEELAVDFQRSVTEVLYNKTTRVVKEYKVRSVVVGGGVAANRYIREVFGSEIEGAKVYFPRKGLSLDNAVIIACAGYYRPTEVSAENIKPNPSLKVEEI